MRAEAMRVIELAEGESANVAPGVIVTATRVQSAWVALGFTAPKEVAIHRAEAKCKVPKVRRDHPREFRA